MTATAAEPAPTSVNASALAVSEALRSGRTEAIESLLAGPIEIDLTHSLSDERHVGAAELADRAAFEQWLSTWRPRYSCPEGAEECDFIGGLDTRQVIICVPGGCCDFTFKEGGQGVRHNALFLNRICFEMDGSIPSALRSIHLVDGD